MRTSCTSPDLTVIHRDGAVRVPSRPGTSDTDIARARPTPDHGASGFVSEKGETRALSLRTVTWLHVASFDPLPIERAPCISRGAATTSDVVRGPCEEAAGRKPCPERGSHGRRTTDQLRARSHWPCTAERSRPCSIGIGRRSDPLLGTGFSTRGRLHFRPRRPLQSPRHVASRRLVPAPRTSP